MYYYHGLLYIRHDYVIEKSWTQENRQIQILTLLAPIKTVAVDILFCIFQGKEDDIPCESSAMRWHFIFSEK